jgi:hypothetical protein
MKRVVLAAAARGEAASRPPRDLAAEYQEELRFELMKAIAPPPPLHSELLHVRQRVIMFGSVHRLQRMNSLSPIKARNLHAILCARFRTTRIMLYRQGVDTDCASCEEDALIEQCFASIVNEEPPAESREAMDKRYLQVIRHFKPVAVYPHYEAMDRRICGHGDGWDDDDDDDDAAATGNERQMFVSAVQCADTYLRAKLAADLRLFESRPARIVDAMREHQAAAGWLTAGGVWAAGVCSFFGLY